MLCSRGGLWWLGSLVLRVVPYAIFHPRGQVWAGAYHTGNYRDLLWSKWLFTSTHNDTEQGRQALQLLANPQRFMSPVSRIVQSDLRTSPLSLIAVKYIDAISDSLRIDSSVLWFLLNCAIDLAIAIEIVNVAMIFQTRTTNTLSQWKTKVWFAKERYTHRIPTTSDEAGDGDDGKDVHEDEDVDMKGDGDVEGEGDVNGDGEGAVKQRLPSTLTPSVILPAAIYLVHPLSIYRCVAAPSFETISLLCLILVLRESLAGLQATPWKILLPLSIYAAVNYSTVVFSLAIPIAASLIGTTRLKNGIAIVSTSEAPLSPTELRNLIFKATIPICILTATLTLTIQAAALYLTGLDWGMAALLQLWTRHLDFEMAQRPDAGALWYLVLVMFKQARSTFFIFLNYHLIVHSFPMTLRFGRQLHFLLLFLTGTIPLYERAVTLPYIVFSLALLTIVYPVLGNIRILWMAIFVQSVSYGLQLFVLDLWVKSDAANINLTYLAAVVPFIMLMVFWLQVLSCIARLKSLKYGKDFKEKVS